MRFPVVEVGMHRLWAPCGGRGGVGPGKGPCSGPHSCGSMTCGFEPPLSAELLWATIELPMTQVGEGGLQAGVHSLSCTGSGCTLPVLRDPELPPFSGWGSANPSLPCREGFYWDGSAVFPEPPPDRLYPNMNIRVSEKSMKYYVDLLLENVKERASWFRTRHLLWPWVRRGPRPRCPQHSPGLLSCLIQPCSFRGLARQLSSALGQCLFPAQHKASPLPPAPPTTLDCAASPT